MQLTVPDDVLEGRKLTQAELLFDLALGLYVDGKLTLGRAAQLAALSKSAFLDELGTRRIPVRYDTDDLRSDLRTLSVLREKGPANPA